MRTVAIAPSVLSADWLQLGAVLRICEEAGADWIHLDVMDGHFVPNLTMGPVFVQHCRRATRLPLDVHLMIANPDQFLVPFAQAGASRLTVHAETSLRLGDTIMRIKELGCEAGVTLRPGTSVGAIDPVLHMVDLVLVMSVDPGFAGQEFMPEGEARTLEIRQKLDVLRSPAWLEVDGGINAETAPRMRRAGADAFVAASAVFQHPGGIAAGIEALRWATERAEP